ncbi:hypothetical protein [Streptomyces lunaelactis]|uniref:hypothetical protein n=1 Tax=Streptomyces lunaelactis TaxID=1535768 RepID=UPI001584ACA6|nr:hypothetical protein [Streptomyces lunaelactis]NUK22041.1 hypothetical protein [Streptomyces lunaelactis]
MPKLNPAQAPEVKLDSAAAAVEASLTRDQRRGLFEKPGTVVVAIVELTSKSYTGHAEGEEKEPQVKVRVTGCEVARSDAEAATLLEAKRAMWRARRMDGTLDEVGPGPRDPEQVIGNTFDSYPSEAEYQDHQRAREQQRRDEYVR